MRSTKQYSCEMLYRLWLFSRYWFTVTWIFRVVLDIWTLKFHWGFQISGPKVEVEGEVQSIPVHVLEGLSNPFSAAFPSAQAQITSATG